MKRKGTGKGLMVVGSMRKDGITTYMKQGRIIIRSANSMEKRSNTKPQFIQRQKMRHSVALWRMMKYCEPMFTKGTTAYTSFLMPGIPVSDGTLPEIKQKLGKVDGIPALITDLKANDCEPWTKLWLYTAVQTGEYRDLHVQFSKREVSWEEMTVVDGHYVLKGEDFSDETKGWALVLVKGERCSPQAIVTHCTLYQEYMTEEALEKAADSYGGLTDTPYLSPSR